ncbi:MULTISPECIES: hypothetical protein [unclassified Gilliamella]|uniref:hypothetical protein n=1 Tax=unclassified Gilliamella TaxID=2685620 RepID=UPI001307D06A|nr:MULTISPECIES: hypothetical protein [unclassified Gilliamella]MWP48588.1 hypothetical protein [Gilliamella sp. Lep-s35]MWP68650.1 hypothetical protein [Gilliamella sp. Lep-s5]MWP76682.1 hypothetical protein [Gilliamella sp. Lep-s21]
MKYELKSWNINIPYEDKRKRLILKMIIFILFGFFMLHVLFFIKISQRIIVSLPIPDILISLVFAVFIAFIFSFRRKTLINKPIKKRIMQYCNRFYSIACLCFIIIFPLFDYYVYFFPKETNTYLTHYEITTSGPRIGRFSSCNKGIKIQDQYTSGIFFLCFNNRKHSDYNTQALVTVQSNSIGSYLVNYDLSGLHQY